MANVSGLIPDVSGTSLADLISLRGRTAVVTGAAQGLGRAIAERLAEAGASVMIADVNIELATTVAAAIADKSGAHVIAHPLDVSDGGAIVAAADAAVAGFGAIDIWVNNAGIFPLSPVLEMTDEEWDRVLSINLRGCFIGAREAAKRMDARGKGGVIINLSSTSGFNGGGPSITHYTASKHGVNGITRQMALELASRGIRVLGVAPTVIVTEGVRHAKAVTTERAGFELDIQTSLLGRSGVPDDVARVVLFCASDLSLFMTGSILLVDAGVMTH